MIEFRLPHLKTLELYGCLHDTAVVPMILSRKPQINLGFLYLKYCSEAGINPLDSQPETCRYANNISVRGNCWGRITGALVNSKYDNFAIFN